MLEIEQASQLRIPATCKITTMFSNVFMIICFFVISIRLNVNVFGLLMLFASDFVYHISSILAFSMAVSHFCHDKYHFFLTWFNDFTWHNWLNINMTA